MIINSNGNEAIILSDGEKKEMKISASDEVQDHIIRVLTDYSYQRKIESIIREAVANSVDSNIEAGKKTAPVFVRLKRGNTGQWYFETEDQGLGLDVEGFDKYIMGIGESTKRNNPETFGYFGGGAKAPLCKVNSFDWICRKDGIERKFTIFKTNTRPNREIIYEQPTDKPNGCIVHIDIPYYENISVWKAAMKEQLAYLPYIVFDVEGENDWNNYKIFQSEDFEFRELTMNKPLHISLGGIYYPIDWTAVGMAQINLPVALRFKLDEGVSPIFSREALQYNPATVELIREKIKKVAKWFQQYYDNSVKSFDTFWEAYPHIDQINKNVEVQGYQFSINQVLQFAGLTVKEPQVKGVANERLVDYKKNFYRFFQEYKTVAQTVDWKSSWLTNSKRHSNVDTAFLQSKQIVVVDELPVGNFREFLKIKFGSKTVFVIKSYWGRKLWKTMGLLTEGSLHSYYDILGLKGYPKNQWREIIKEWQMVRDQFTGKFLDGELKDSYEYKAFLDEKKEHEREKRRQRGIPVDSLNKQKGQVTIGEIRKTAHHDKGTYDRYAINIGKLEKAKHLYCYFIWDEGLEKWNILKEFKKMFPRVKFIGINQTEIKLIKHIYQFKTIEEFMQARPFARAVTSIAIKKYLDKIPSSESFLYEAFPKYKEMKRRLKDYVKANAQDVTSDFAEELFEMAEKNGNWDMNIYPEFLQFKKIMDDFQFLRFFKNVDGEYSVTDYEMKMIRTLIYVYTRDRKIENHILTSYELVDRNQAPKYDYYRPETDSSGYVLGHDDEWIADSEAWRSEEAVLRKYPNSTPVGYKKGDREDLNFQDVEDEELEVA